jgi:hypothetical protein
VLFDDAEAEATWNSGSLKRGKAGKAAPDSSASVAIDAADGPLRSSAERTPDPQVAVQQQRPSASVDAAALAAQSSPAPDAEAIPGLDDSGDNVVLGNVIGMAVCGPTGSPAPRDTVSDERSDAVAFPGLNAPIPEGADPDRWGITANGTLHGVRAIARRQAAIGGSSVATGQGVKRGFEAADVLDSGPAQQRYGSRGHSAAVSERQRYRARHPGPVPSAPLQAPMAQQPLKFSDKLAPLPHGHPHQPQQQNGLSSRHPNLVFGHGGDHLYQHHHNGFIARQPGPLAQPSNAGYAAHNTQMASYQQASYPHSSTAGMPAVDLAASYVWQHTAQWPVQPNYPSSMTPSRSWH